MRIILALALAIPLAAQQPLDPTRNLPPSPAPAHTPLPRALPLDANDITAQRPDHNKFPWNRPDLRIAPHFFRTSFTVNQKTAQATLYIAGPRSARVWINGALAATFNSDISAPIGFHLFHADIASYLKPGPNTLAIEAIRGRGIVAATGSLATQQITYGEVLAAKIIPAAFGSDAPGARLLHARNGRAPPQNPPTGSSPSFDDAAWPAAATLGPIESDPDLMQWNADAGMYEWPGYLGMSPELRTLALEPSAITHIFEGSSHVSVSGPRVELTSFTPQTDQESPAILLDFGREIAGRLLIQSASPCESTISLAYGESELEALATGLTLRAARRKLPWHEPPAHSAPRNRPRPQVRLPLRPRPLSARLPDPHLRRDSRRGHLLSRHLCRLLRVFRPSSSTGSGRPAPTPHISACRTASGTLPKRDPRTLDRRPRHRRPRHLHRLRRHRHP